MKKYIYILILICVSARPASAQFTTVTATVQDPNGIPYAGAVMNAILVPSTGGGYTLGGQPYSGRIGPVTLDSTGSFTVNFGDVTLITPGSPQWQITISSAAATIGLPMGTGPQSFIYTSSGTTISGSSPVSLTSALNALAPKLTNFIASALAPNTPGIPVYCGPACIYAANYGVKGNAIRYSDCSFVNTSKNVTCGISPLDSDVPFTPAMCNTGPGGGGWLVFGTNGSPTAGAQPSATAILPVGTITTCTDSTHISVSVAATAGCTSTVGTDNCQLVIAPNDDTAALQLAFNAAASASLGANCGFLMLVRGNMWVSDKIWTSGTSVACDNAQQANGTAMGATVGGYGYNQSVIIPAPSAHWANVLNNTAAFFFSLAYRGTGWHYRNFSIDGAGQQANVGANGAALLLGQNSSMTDIGIFQWGTAYAVQAGGSDGAEAIIDHCYLGAAGTTYIVNENFDVKMTNTAVFWGVGTAMLNVQSIQNTSIADTFDNPGGSTIMVSIGAVGVLWSTADYFETPEGSAAISLGTSGGVLHLAHADFRNPQGSTSVGISSVAGTSVYMQDSIMSLNANSAKALNIAGAFYDLGGNNIQTATANTISGNVFGSASVTGTAASAGNWAFSAGWGTTAAATSVSGNTQRTRYTLTASGSGQGASPTITHTFATVFLTPPLCTIKQDGGTQTAVANPFTVGSPTTTSVVYTYTGTPGAGNTLVLEEDCSNP